MENVGDESQVNFGSSDDDDDGKNIWGAFDKNNKRIHRDESGRNKYGMCILRHIKIREDEIILLYRIGSGVFCLSGLCGEFCGLLDV